MGTHQIQSDNTAHFLLDNYLLLNQKHIKNCVFLGELQTILDTL